MTQEQKVSDANVNIYSTCTVASGTCSTFRCVLFIPQPMHVCKSAPTEINQLQMHLSDSDKIFLFFLPAGHGWGPNERNFRAMTPVGGAKIKWSARPMSQAVRMSTCVTEVLFGLCALPDRHSALSKGAPELTEPYQALAAATGSTGAPYSCACGQRPSGPPTRHRPGTALV